MTAFTPFAEPTLFGDTTLTPDGANYVAKLKRSRRPTALILAFIALLLAYLRAGHFLAHGPSAVLRPETARLATAIAQYVADQFHVSPPVASPIAATLERHLADYAGKARADGLDTAAMGKRLTLIVIAETQRATASALQAAAAEHGISTIVRETTSADPCDTCQSLVGTYTEPFPSDLWYTHPRCACIWSRSDG